MHPLRQSLVRCPPFSNYPVSLSGFIPSHWVRIAFWFYPFSLGSNRFLVLPLLTGFESLSGSTPSHWVRIAFWFYPFSLGSNRFLVLPLLTGFESLSGLIPSHWVRIAFWLHHFSLGSTSSRRLVYDPLIIMDKFGLRTHLIRYNPSHTGLAIHSIQKCLYGIHRLPTTRGIFILYYYD